ncbi:hypothetical protein AVEN_82341-1 [Araneus ventricosus]|uniref:Integrase catalytic domain-containing protein n=1 Tax=Araneus ventricosus TaxID=182803 RepID=A0A4Y2IUQ1_ARAVE|nr:hypothetical protein AVEN_82341-1 [Araneus ventricosus]
MKENADSVLGFSRENAVKRLNGIWNKLNKNNTLATLYKAFLQEYLDLGHMQQIIDEDNTKSYYIPHHCIYKPEKTTTPLRVVFDASAETSTGQSLNSILLNGGSIQDDLFSLVTRFRTHKYAFSADIQKMYRQILVEPSQRYLQRIVWKETNNSPIKIYELNTVTYGTVSAPFLAMRVLKALADAEHQDFPEAAKIISRDMYMDDILSGAKSLTSAKRLQADLSKLLRRGGFELHKWVSNHPALLNDISTSEYSFEDTQSNTVKALGMLWKPQPDQLTFKVSVKKKDSLTKREVLSQIARLYDPLGIIGPVIAKAKVFMQSLWLQKLDWNDNLPTKVLQVWNDFLVKLPGVNEINVPRYILSEDVTKIELHGFSDASERAYGAVIYIRCVTHSGLIQTKLVCSKSRVSPLKPITVPRLELSAALLLARLMHKIVPVLDLPLDKVCLWTDSKIVLAWLNMQPHVLKTFVSNRVAKIQSLCSNSQWRHVSSKCNPADVLSRGADAKDLRNNDLWWQGPEFLLRDITDPEEYPCPKDKTFEQELKRNVTVSCAVTNDFDFLDKLLNLTNNYSKLIRILSFCCRFIKNCLHKNVETGFLTAAELDSAEQLLIKQVQFTTFAKEITAIQDGAQGLLHQVRLRYWPLNGKSTARMIVHNCVICYKNKPVIADQIMGNLPKERVTPTSAFTNCGIDFCGPFLIKFKNQRKGIYSKIYVAIFICLSTKAIHLETVSDLSSEAFIASLKRFIARRGKMSMIITDNATNFKGAKSELNRLFNLIRKPDECLANYLSSERINWKLIPPRSPNFGGLWEAGVKSFKYHLKRTIGLYKVTREEFDTIIIQIEGILNSRPLSPLSSDINEYEVLTPAHFLIGRPITAIPEPEIIIISDNKLSRWQQLTKFTQIIWKRWQREYLNHLQQRYKWQLKKDNLREGMIVIVKEDNLPMCKWALAKILEIIRGTDNHIRVVKLKTASGTFIRSISKICVLPNQEVNY